VAAPPRLALTGCAAAPPARLPSLPVRRVTFLAISIVSIGYCLLAIASGDGTQPGAAAGLAAANATTLAAAAGGANATAIGGAGALNGAANGTNVPPALAAGQQQQQQQQGGAAGQEKQGAASQQASQQKGPPAAGIYAAIPGLRDIDGAERPLSAFAGKVTMFVNVASQCGYTQANYVGLQALYEKYRRAHAIHAILAAAVATCHAVWGWGPL
jgi:hypothetical protein